MRHLILRVRPLLPALVLFAILLVVSSAPSISSAATTTFTPVADSYVDSANPTVNYGAQTQLRVDASPTMESYLRFNVQGLAGSVITATLRIYANNTQSTGYSVKQVANNIWTETGITYNNAPAIGDPIGSSGPVTGGTWMSVDVTTYITGNGTFSVALRTSNSDLTLASR